LPLLAEVTHAFPACGWPGDKLGPGVLAGLAAGDRTACPACPSRSAGVAAPPPAAGGTARVGAAGRAVRAYTATATARAHAAAAAARTIRDDLVMSGLPSGSDCPLGGNDTGPALGLHANQGPGGRDETLGSVPFPNNAYGPMNHWADVAFTTPGAVATRLSAASSPFEREQPDCCPFIGWFV